MENFRNYYEILGVEREATGEEIKRVFRQLARRYHPDLNPGDKAAEEQFKVISEAYEVLSDVERRSQYDEFSSYWNQDGFEGFGDRPRGSWGINWRSAPIDFSQFPDFNIFVDELLGKTPPRDEDFGPGKETRWAESPRREDPLRDRVQRASPYPNTDAPRDVEAHLVVPLEQAYAGGPERIRLEDGRAIELDMPAGLATGQQIRLRGQGISGGDLYLKIEVPEHSFYRLDGTDIYCQVPVSPVEAVLGAPIEVPTLDGPVQINVPLGLRPGQWLRLAGKGYPDDAGVRGDQILELVVMVPLHLTEEERSLYEKLYQVESFDPRRDLPL